MGCIFEGHPLINFSKIKTSIKPQEAGGSKCWLPKGAKNETERGVVQLCINLQDIYVHESTITVAQKLKRGGEDVAQMRTETLLPVEA